MLKKLIWDSNFFNINIFTIDLNNYKFNKLNNEIKKLNNALIQVNIDVNKKDLIQKFINFGFAMESVSSTFQKKKIGTEYIDYRLANNNDLKKLRIISKNLFTKTRIKDQYFGTNSSHKFYAKWLENSVNGSHDDCCLLTSDDKNNIMGFVTLKKNIDNIRIGLFGIAKNYQKKGIGSKLLQVVESFKKSNNIEISLVTTQQDNLTAKKLYIKNGYKLVKNIAWLYLKN